MGMFDQLRAAQEMMKNMSPEQIQGLMKQAQDSKSMMEDMVKKLVAEEVTKRNLMSRDEVARMIAQSK
ncbi:MAG: hypothetical protein AAB372_00930 [Patescibacteria group bacterium]